MHTISFFIKALAAFLCVVVSASTLLAAPSSEEIKQATTEIDVLLAAHWKSAALKPNDPVTDETFIRRIYLDLTGTHPPPEKIESFPADPNPAKRQPCTMNLACRGIYHGSNRHQRKGIGSAITYFTVGMLSGRWRR